MPRPKTGNVAKERRRVLKAIMEQDRPFDGVTKRDLQSLLFIEGEKYPSPSGMALSHALWGLLRIGAIRAEKGIGPKRRCFLIFPSYNATYWMEKWKLVEKQRNAAKSASKPQKNSKIEQPDYSQAKFSPKFIELLASKGKIAVWKKTSDGWKWTQGTKEEAERLNLHVFDPQAHSKAEEVAQ